MKEHDRAGLLTQNSVKELFTVLVKYIGDADENGIKNVSGGVQLLLGDYAIVEGTRDEIDEIIQNQNVIYIERPEEMYFSKVRGQTENGETNLYAMQVSAQERICKSTPDNETGKGVIMAYLDSGIDYRHEEFIDQNGESRILSILDLRQAPERLYSNEDINEALSGGGNMPTIMDSSGHGTHVAAIGSGNSGVAPESAIVMVALRSEDGKGVSTVDFMKGVDFCIRIARERQQPIVLNISIGNNMGAHNGTTLVERYLDDVLDYAKASIVVGIGNEGIGISHYRGLITKDIRKQVEFSVGLFQPGMTIQIWKDIRQKLSIQLVSPTGQRIEFGDIYERSEYQFRNEKIQIIVEEPTPVQIDEKIQINMIPNEEFLTQGIWNLYFTTNQKEAFEIDIWMPVSEALSELTGFLEPSPMTTLTIPSSATRVITVGAFDTRTNQIADFSGHGYTWKTALPKPDLVAPGVNILSAARGGGYTVKTGTSMATPFVSGAAALLMEWGIVRQNDPFLYGDKLKAYLRKGANPVAQFSTYPNEYAGYGELCIRESFP